MTLSSSRCPPVPVTLGSGAGEGEGVGVTTALGDAAGLGEGEAGWALTIFAPATIDNERRTKCMELAFCFILSLKRERRSLRLLLDFRLCLRPASSKSQLHRQ